MKKGVHNTNEKSIVNLGRHFFLFPFFLLCFSAVERKEEGRRGMGYITVAVAAFVSCQLLGGVVETAFFITFDGAGLDLANLVTL